jgi:hypothetical protein
LARIQGGLIQSREATKIAAQMAATRGIMDTLKLMTDQLITADGWMEAVPQAVRLHLGAITKSNTVAAVYKDTKKQFLGVLSKSLAQERGVLTNVDIERMANGLVKFGDTKAIASLKNKIVFNIIEIAENQALAMKTGGAPESVNVRERIQSLIKELEGVKEKDITPEGVHDPEGMSQFMIPGAG